MKFNIIALLLIFSISMQAQDVTVVRYAVDVNLNPIKEINTFTKNHGHDDTRLTEIESEKYFWLDSTNDIREYNETSFIAADESKPKTYSKKTGKEFTEADIEEAISNIKSKIGRENLRQELLNDLQHNVRLKDQYFQSPLSKELISPKYTLISATQYIEIKSLQDSLFAQLENLETIFEIEEAKKQYKESASAIINAKETK